MTLGATEREAPACAPMPCAASFQVRKTVNCEATSDDPSAPEVAPREAQNEAAETDEATVALVGMAQGGNRAALTALVESYRPLLYRAARSARPFTPLSTVDDDDLRQEAVKSLIELVLEYRPKLGPVGPYLKRKLSWRLANYVRAEQRRSGFGRPLAPKASRAAAATSNARYSGLGLRGVSLQSLLRQLSPRQRAIIYKHHWEDKKPVEVARELGITLQAVTALRRRAEKTLRQRLLDSQDASPTQEQA